MGKLIALVIVALALPAGAQVFNIEQDRVQMATLDGQMRFHTGDDPHWADPALDDSAWPLISSADSWSGQGYKDYGGFAWYRFKVILPSEHRKLALYIPRIMTSYQVFADGKLLGSFGGFPPHATVFTIHRKLLLLPSGQGGQMEIAIRVWHWPHWAMYYGGGILSPLRIGDAAQLQHWMSLQDKTASWRDSAQNYSALLNFLYCVAGFALYLGRRREHLYLWYGLAGLFFGSWSLANSFASFHDMPIYMSGALSDGLSIAGFFSFVVFIWWMLGVRRTFWIWVGAGAVASVALMWALPPLRNLPVSVGNCILTLVRLPLTLGPLVMLIQGVKRQNPDARLLLIPVGLNTLANWINDGLWAILTSGNAWAEPYWNFWSSTFSWPFPFSLYDLSIWILLIAILAIVVLRFARSRHEEDLMKREMEAARTIQQVLVPTGNPAVPGFQIDSIYRPASEVGGDFFQIVPTSSGAVLAVIGDVSGKGMPAAMTVSLLVGTFRTLAHYTNSPSEILSAMNQRMLGRNSGGFTTCLVFRVDSDGSLTAANAGHLAPYLNGKELLLENSLPLGLNADAQYTESTTTLAPGSRLTLLTDGVVEAQSPTGELFGFERTQQISRLSAEQIAAAARAHGQEDDITVLTLTFAPTEAL